MLFLSLSIYLIWLTFCVHSTHFRGGYISWQAVSPNITNTSTVTISISQTYSWANSVILCGPLIGDASYLTCISSNCSNYTNTTSVRGPCISYDLGLDISTAQSKTSLTLLANSQLVLAYQSTNWLTLVYGFLYPPWSLLIFINLAVRTDNGQINSSPTSNMAPLINVIVNTKQTLRIPVADIDLDVIKCRWATNATLIGSKVVDECGGVCQNMPNAQLYSTSNSDNNCTLVFNTTIVGYYVIALQIEDFMPSDPNGTALSSVPLQFLIRAISTSCKAPTIIGELADGTTIEVQYNTTFSISVIAQIGCNGTSITRFSTITIPSSTAGTSTIVALSTSLYAILFVWTPNVNQIGTTQLYCTMAIASNNLQSAQYCLNFVVAVPTTVTTTTTISSTTITTTTVVTTAESNACTSMATSSSVDNQSNDSSLILGLSLGLGLSSLLLSTLLSCLCCCRHCKHPFWKQLRQRFWQEKNIYCSACQDQNSKNKKTINNNTRQYREQYINEHDQFELGSRTVTKTTFMPSSSNSIVPIEFEPSRIISPPPLLPSTSILLNGSLLVKAFTEQEMAKHDSFIGRPCSSAS